MSSFNDQQFEKKLQTLKDSQESIQTLSSWCLQNRQYHKKIVNCWLKTLKKVKVESRLTLFYLANDVIQYSKRKNYDYVQSWAPALQRATPQVRDEKVKHSILRIFKIWDERGIYDELFISDLISLLANAKNSTSESTPQVVTEFQPQILITKIGECKELEDDTDLQLKKVNESHLNLSDADALRASLKDRRQGDDLVSEVDEGAAKMEAYVNALKVEIKERVVLIDLLEQGEVFYETQKGEAKVVANAYKNFGNRVKKLKLRLDEVMPTLKEISPIPSPDVNAPSPSPDSDIELPEEVMEYDQSEFSQKEDSSSQYDDSQPSRFMPVKNYGASNEYKFSSFNSVGSDKKSPLESSSSTFEALMATESQSSRHSNSDLTKADNCRTSFMGNSGFPFDVHKSLFGETSADTPRSPSPIPIMDEDPILEDQPDPADIPSPPPPVPAVVPVPVGPPTTAAAPLPVPAPVSAPVTEGKPIEVINSRNKGGTGFSIAEFLKSLTQKNVDPAPIGKSSPVIPGLDLDSNENIAPLPPLTTMLEESMMATIPKESNTPYSTSNSANSNHYNYQIHSAPSQIPLPPMPPPPPTTVAFPADNYEQWTNPKYSEPSDRVADKPVSDTVLKNLVNLTNEWNTKLPPKFPTWGDPVGEAGKNYIEGTPERASIWEASSDYTTSTPLKNSGWEVDNKFGGSGSPQKKPKLLGWYPDPDPSCNKKLSDGSDHLIETPESPPLHEKEGFSDPVEYDDTEEMLMGGDVDHRSDVRHKTDIDHRTLVPLTPAQPPPPPPPRNTIQRHEVKKDVDHRNLISLTGSPRHQDKLKDIPPPPPKPPGWPPSFDMRDQDYRLMPSSKNITESKSSGDLLMGGDRDYRLSIPLPPQPPPPLPPKAPPPQNDTGDNIESVDMEMSDEDEEIGATVNTANIIEVVTNNNSISPVQQKPAPALKDVPLPEPENKKPVENQPIKFGISFGMKSAPFNNRLPLKQSPLFEPPQPVPRPVLSRPPVPFESDSFQKIPTIGAGLGFQRPSPRPPGPPPGPPPIGARRYPFHGMHNLSNLRPVLPVEAPPVPPMLPPPLPPNLKLQREDENDASPRRDEAEQSKEKSTFLDHNKETENTNKNANKQNSSFDDSLLNNTSTDSDERLMLPGYCTQSATGPDNSIQATNQYKHTPEDTAKNDELLIKNLLDQEDSDDSSEGESFKGVSEIVNSVNLESETVLEESRQSDTLEMNEKSKSCSSEILVLGEIDDVGKHSVNTSGDKNTSSEDKDDVVTINTEDILHFDIPDEVFEDQELEQASEEGEIDDQPEEEEVVLDKDEEISKYRNPSPPSVMQELSSDKWVPPAKPIKENDSMELNSLNDEQDALQDTKESPLSEETSVLSASATETESSNQPRTIASCITIPDQQEIMRVGYDRNDRNFRGRYGWKFSNDPYPSRGNFNNRGWGRGGFNPRGGGPRFQYNDGGYGRGNRGTFRPWGRRGRW